jgi:hypothetical protein
MSNLDTIKGLLPDNTNREIVEKDIRDIFDLTYEDIEKRLNEDQANLLYLKISEYIINGKIKADKIESLGLTDLIQANENTISQFANNSNSYEFQKNDFIAIPNNTGTFNLYIFRGNDKTDPADYLPTGITNITIDMVQGLQAALDAKLNKPAGNGNFFINQIGTNITFKNINPAANYLLYWNGSDFIVTDIYKNAGKYGVATTTPSEMLHLFNGRIRTKAIVLDENNEQLPGQITYVGRRFAGTDDTGVSRNFMYKDYADFIGLVNSLTQAQKDVIGAAWNSQYSNGSLNVYSITPTVMKNDHVVRYLVLQGLNLNVNPSMTSVKFIPLGNAIGTGEIDCLGFQTFADGKSMIVSVYGDSLPSGIQYNLIIRTGSQTHRTTSSINVVTNINNIDVNSLNWQTKAYTAGQEGTVFTSNGGLFAYTSSPDNKAYAYEPNQIVLSAKSDVVFSVNTNFYLEVNFSLSNSGTTAVSDANDFYAYLGLLQNSIPISLADNSFLRVPMASFRSGGYSSVIVWNNLVTNPNRLELSGGLLNANLIIMRTGNIYTQFLTVGSTTVIQSVTSTTEAVSLSLVVSNGTTNKNINGSIVQAFTF